MIETILGRDLKPGGQVMTDGGNVIRLWRTETGYVDRLAASPIWVGERTKKYNASADL